jgi:hypothetical protein
MPGASTATTAEGAVEMAQFVPKRPTFRTESGGGLYYGSKYLLHPALFPEMDMKGTLIKLVKTSVIAEEDAVLAVASALSAAYSAGQYDDPSDV